VPRFEQAPPLSLYVHLPWCVRKCPYCDFNSHALRGEAPVEAYVDALLRDAEAEATRASGREVMTVFLGGGTPSLFPPRAIERLLKGLRERLNIADGAEVTMEANPGTLEQDHFAGFREAGVNRLSIGVQSFSPHHLSRLGRIHGPREAIDAAESARRAGFQQFNLDLMFALPEQRLDEALEDVETALSLDPPHISYYQLTLEPETAFHARPPRLPDEDAAYTIQQEAHARLRRAGFENYEVSAWGRAGERCRHNLNYWTFGDYLAVGAGAHGKVTDATAGRIIRYAKPRLPRAYMATAGQTAERRELDAADIVLEFMMNAMRLPGGVPRDLATQRTGLPWSALEPGLQRALKAGLVNISEDRLAPTEQGLLFLNDLLACFLEEAA
jgi:oxygen-independent coproporphyrinogen-3 oxidase